MCIRDRDSSEADADRQLVTFLNPKSPISEAYRILRTNIQFSSLDKPCLLYTSDAADERSSVDLGGRRIIKKKNNSRAGAACVRIIKTQRQHSVDQTYTWEQCSDRTQNQC